MKKRLSESIAYIQGRLYGDPSLDLIEDLVIDEAVELYMAPEDNRWAFKAELLEAFF